MAVPVNHQLAEVGVVCLGDNGFAQTQTAGDEKTAAFLFDNNVDAADIAGVLDVDFSTYEFGTLGQFHSVVVEFGDSGGLNITGACGI